MTDPDGRGMLDTSTVILLGRLTDPSTLPADSVISAITLAELSVGPHVARTRKERAARQAHLQQAESDFDTIPFGPEAARAFGRVAASLRSAGRKPAARAYDTLIAASALAENIPIHTCNPDDFKGIEGLEVRAVPHPDRAVARLSPLVRERSPWLTRSEFLSRLPRIQADPGLRDDLAALDADTEELGPIT